MSVMQKKMPQRIVICTSDVQIIIGVKPRAARKLLQDIRLKLGKPKKAFITVRDFSQYTGIDEELVRASMIY